MENYWIEAKGEWAGNPFASKMRNKYKEDLTKFVSNFKNDFGENYVIRTSKNNRWISTPWYAILNNKITNSPQNGYYIVFLFKADMSGFYLSLNFGSYEFNEIYSEDDDITLKKAADNFRNILKNEFKFKYVPMDLGNRPDGKTAKNNKDYQDGDVFNVFYSFNELPSDEKLKIDLELFFSMYEFLINKRKKEIFTDEELRNIDKIKYVENYMECKNFFKYLEYKGFYFNKDTVINYLLSLKVKPFVIFTGNSGTGKTQLAKLFAEYTMSKLKIDENYKLVPVGANWTETRHIVGFYNVISKKYVSTPSLSLIREAKGKNKPYFLILDEMNLSHVERYFSDFLSAIESKKGIPLHNSIVNIEDENEKDIEKDLLIPENLFIIGTVNIDETTYMFSPKVLDRANIIEFETFSNDTNNLSIEKYMNNDFKYDENISDDAFSFLENPLSNLDLQDITISKLKDMFNDDEIWKELSDELTNFHTALKKSNFEFGFRTVNEVLAFMYVSKEYEKLLGNNKFDNWTKYFDAQIKQKILPKLHGSESLMSTLEELLDNCYDKNGENNMNNSDKVKYPSSAKKLKDMIDILKKQKYVSFIN